MHISFPLHRNYFRISHIFVKTCNFFPSSPFKKKKKRFIQKSTFKFLFTLKFEIVYDLYCIFFHLTFFFHFLQEKDLVSFIRISFSMECVRWEWVCEGDVHFFSFCLRRICFAGCTLTKIASLAMAFSHSHKMPRQLMCNMHVNCI